MVYTIVNRNIQRAPRREKKKSQYFYFGQKRQHFLTNQTMGTTRCGEMQFHAGPSSSGVLFLSHSHVHTIQYIRQHMMCVYYYHKTNICHAQMAMKHHIYIYMVHHHHHDKNSPWLINGSTEFLSQAVGIDRGIGFSFSFPFSVFEIRGVFLKVSAKGTVFSSLVPFFSTDLLPNIITINIYYLTHLYLLMQSKFKGTIHAWRPFRFPLLSTVEVSSHAY